MSEQAKDQVAEVARISPLKQRLKKPEVEDEGATLSISDFAPDQENDNRRTDYDHTNVRRLIGTETPTETKPKRRLRPVRESQYTGKIHIRARPDDIERFAELAEEHGLKHGHAFKRMVDLLEQDLGD